MNKQKSLFSKNGNYYIIEKDNFESIEKFNERGWFIANISPKNDKEFNEAILLSRIMINIKYNGAIYDKILMKKISDLE